jgi:hypothetical protein
MTYYPDLAPNDYLLIFGPEVVSIGWLDAEHPYSRGEVSPEHVRALERLLVHGWQPVYVKGWEACPFCGVGEEQPLFRDVDGERRMVGADNLFVPAGDVLYLAPSMILHYVEEHGYAPPEEFLRALERCDPTTEAYRAACERLADLPATNARTDAARAAARARLRDEDG